MKSLYKKACPPSLRSGVSGRGITIIELLIILAILSILFAVTLPQFLKIKESQVLKTATSDALSSINKARSQTLTSLNSSEYGVHFESDRVIIFKGKVYSSSDPDNETILIMSPVTISDVTFGEISATSGDVYFDRFYAVPSTTGTITISASSLSKIITISATGVASSN